MAKGLVFLKAYPLHNGHVALIDFASKRCDKLYVLLCVSKNQDIPGYVRLNWLKKLSEKYTNIKIKYTDVDLPNTSVADREVSKLWSDYFKTILNVDIVFTSEKYGDYVAEYMNIKHIKFDEPREIVPVSATEIRNNPFKNWKYLPDFVKPYFVKKIVILGTESTGKTTMTKKLARYFDTNYVKEWGRVIVNKTDQCTMQNIMDIASIQAIDINDKINSSYRLLFSDTNLDTTKMYSQYLFGEIPKFDDWIENANKFDLYLYLDNDCPYIQDGTRLEKEKRDGLRNYQLEYLKDKNYNLEIINGNNWVERRNNAIDVIKSILNINI